jgi:hypothetical protein
MRIRNAPLAWTLFAMLVALAATPFVPRVLRACGPYFALEVLPTRATDVLKSPPAPSIFDGLVPKPGDGLKAYEVYDEHEQAKQLERSEREGLPLTDNPRLEAMRALTSGEAAYAAGEGMPEAVRAYTAGAVSYHQRKFDQAQHYFERVLALKPHEEGRERRVVWASYMLGTIARLQGNDEAAAAHWATTRGLVRSGLNDPLGLAVASFGEEARLYLHAGTITKAVALYARQAAYPSESGQSSLLEVAGQILKDPALLEESIDDPLSRQLLLRYLYAHSEDATRVDGVIEAFEKHRVSNAEGADLLAAAAYAAGRFDAATKLVAYQKTPLSAWITGKLALRRGDRAAALASFAEAVKSMPPLRDARSQVRAEIGILRLSAGEFAQAMEVFYGAIEDAWWDRRGGTNYWADLAYLAERVLTIDELLPIVDRLAPPPTRAALANAEGHGRELPAASLRLLTARRLMRAGRYREALRYFDADEHLHHVAEDYTKAVTKANNRWRTQGARAEAWFTAATIARHDGLELLGFELEPDYAMFEGAFSFDTSHIPKADDAAAPAVVRVTAEERARAEASKPPVPERFHYRLTAADQALAGADLLPRRSQAFAAV